MEKEAVIHLTNTSIKVIQGSISANKTITIDSFEEIALLEGTMLDGGIMDEEGVKSALRTIYQQGIHAARLVIDSGQILRKNAIIPKLKHDEILQVCKDELNTLEGENEDLIYDYTILQEQLKEQEGMEVLCCAIAKKFLKVYVDIFEQTKIKLLSIDIASNVLYKLTKIIPEFSNKTYAITNFDGNDVSSSLFVDNHLAFTIRSRLFAERGSIAFVSELTTNITQLIQFNKSQYKDKNLEVIYFSGLDKYEEDMIYDAVKNSLDIRAERFPSSKNITCIDATMPFEIHTYIFATGGLIRK